MLQRFRTGRRAALPLALLALLTLGAAAFAPGAGATWTGPHIRVVTIDAHTLRVYGGGFSSLGRVHYWTGEPGDPGHHEGWLWAAQAYFGCTPIGCASGGGTFTQDVQNIRCGSQVLLEYIDMDTGHSAYGTYAAPC